jgi:transcriptional regulator with XRE-family HTH domain
VGVEEAGIGARVRAARERLGWTREALAFHSGISWSGIAQVETGRRKNVRPGTLAALAEALGVTIDYLVGGGSASAPLLQHQALLYDSDEEFVGAAGPFLADGVDRSEAVLAVTTSANIELLREHLGAEAERVDFVESDAWYTTPRSALEAYRAFASDKVAAGAPWVRIVGEPVWEGRSASEIDAWTRYESVLNLVFATWPATIVCPYDRRSAASEITRQACRTHPHTNGRKGVAESPDYADPSEFALGPAA